MPDPVTPKIIHDISHSDAFLWGTRKEGFRENNTSYKEMAF